MAQNIIKYLSFIAFLGLFSCADQITENTDSIFDQSGLEAKFASIQEEIFTPSCATSGCHNDGGVIPVLTAGNAYNNIVGVTVGGNTYIQPNDPANSYLLSKLIGTGITGAQMPRGGTALTAAQIDSISQWITDGAPNN